MQGSTVGFFVGVNFHGMAGWIKLHRSVLKHWIWTNPDYVKAWLTILLTVNHEETRVLIHGELITCGRGQSILSLQSWTKLFGRKWTIQKIRTFFDLLKVDGMIVTEGLRKTTRLTVCNYDTYQDEQQTDNIQRTDKEQTDNTQITTNKKDKKDKKEKNKDIVIDIASFKKSIEPFVEIYGRDMCNDFYFYWTEPTLTGNKVRFQLEKTWDTKRRLARWSQNKKVSTKPILGVQKQKMTY